MRPHEQLRACVWAFASIYNREWLIERQGYTRSRSRERMLRQLAVA